jgi:ABC-2 type transport system permease protein
MLSLRSLAIARTGARLLLSDPAPIIVNLVMPLILTAFLIPATRAQLRADGVIGATGAEQVVPGMAIMFAFLSTSLIGTLFFREHAWGTWERLRASSASSVDIVVGKVAPLFVTQLLQVTVLLVAGRWLFGYRPKGSLVALAAIVVLFVAMLVAYGVMLVAVFATMDQAVVIGNLGGMLMAGLGGALAPITALPGWVQAIAHATPAYWALDGLRTVTLREAGIADLATPMVVLTGFTVGFLAVAVLRFRPSDSKIGTT